MDRISGMNYVVVDGLRKFTGSPPGTVLSADWLNGLQEELLHVIEEGGGLSPDAADTTQVLESIQRLVAAAWATGNFNVKFVRSDYHSDIVTGIADMGTAAFGVLVVDDSVTLTSNLTVPKNITLWFLGPGKIVLGTYDLTIQGAITASPSTRCFDDSGGGSVSVDSDRVSEVNPLWWYSGSGAHTTAITSAVNAFSRVAFYGSQSGTTYTIGAEIVLPAKDLELFGYGMPTIDGTAYGYSFRYVTNSKFYHVRDLKFSGGARVYINDAGGVYSDLALNNYLVENCFFNVDQSNYNAGVQVNYGGSGTVRDCYFTANGKTNSVGIYLINSASVLIDRCVIEDVTYGIFANNTSSVKPGPIIRSCRVEDCTVGYFGAYLKRTSVEDCGFTDCVNPIKIEDAEEVNIVHNSLSTDGGASATYGINIYGSSTNCYHIRIRDNKLTNLSPSTWSGIRIEDAFDVVIEGNWVEDYTQYGIYLDDVDNARIENNKLVEDAGGGSVVSIQCSSCDNDTVFIEKNFVDNPIVGGRCRANTGHKVRTAGVVTMAQHDATEVVTHGLSVTPDWVLITSEEEAETLAVTAISSTTFTITALSGDVASNTTVYWEAMLTTQAMIN